MSTLAGPVPATLGCVNVGPEMAGAGKSILIFARLNDARTWRLVTPLVLLRTSRMNAGSWFASTF